MAPRAALPQAASSPKYVMTIDIYSEIIEMCYNIQITIDDDDFFYCFSAIIFEFDLTWVVQPLAALLVRGIAEVWLDTGLPLAYLKGRQLGCHLLQRVM